MTTTITTTTTVVTETTQTVASTLPAKTRLIVVLDRSGSMTGIKDEAIGGYNAFTDGQKKVEGEASITLVLFDSYIETVYENLNLKEVPVLDGNVYVPRAMTALYDAIGVTITKYLATPTDANTKTILAILTDGDENSSKEYTGAAVAKLIKQVETENKWDVLFLGANIDVASIAKDLNIQSGKFAAFAASSKGIADTFASVNAVTSMYRGMASGQSFSASDLNLQTQYDAHASK
jgi:hypothetical protein